MLTVVFFPVGLSKIGELLTASWLSKLSVILLFIPLFQNKYYCLH